MPEARDALSVRQPRHFDIMPITVKLNYLRISPRKVRLIADLIRKKTVQEAERILEFTVKKSATPLQKLLKSATATAENDFKLNKLNLYVSKILVNEGPTLKRWRPRARGRIHPIKKRTSHITLVLDEIESGKKIRPAKKLKKISKQEMESKKLEVKKAKTEKLRPKIKIPRPDFKKTTRRIFRRKAF